MNARRQGCEKRGVLGSCCRRRCGGDARRAVHRESLGCCVCSGSSYRFSMLYSSCAVLRAPVSLLFGHVVSPLSSCLRCKCISMCRRLFFFSWMTFFSSRKSWVSVVYAKANILAAVNSHDTRRDKTTPERGCCFLSRFSLSLSLSPSNRHPERVYYLPQKQRNNRFWWTCGLYNGKANCRRVKFMLWIRIIYFLFFKREGFKNSWFFLINFSKYPLLFLWNQWKPKTHLDNFEIFTLGN